MYVTLYKSCAPGLSPPLCLLSPSQRLSLPLRSGNKQAREGTATFLIRHSTERNHFHCVRCYARVVYRVVHRVLSASCVVSMQRRIGASISVPYATDRSIGIPELRHRKRHFQTDPDVKFRKTNCCCAAPDGRKHVELRKTSVNEVSLSGAR